MGKKKTLRDHASELADTLAPHVETARDKAGPVLADARDKAAPLIAEARDKAAPVLADAREKAAPYVSDARDKFTDDVLPVVTAALAAVDEATEEARHETLKRGKAVASALKGEIAAPVPPQKRSTRGPKLLVLLGLGGIAYAVSKKFGSGRSTGWQTSSTPSPTGTTAGAHRAPTADDVAASDPAEAASDATDIPHAASTPDHPVDEVELKKP